MKTAYSFLQPWTIILLFFVIVVSSVMSEPIQKAVYSYLCLTKPIKAEVLVVEGWLSDCMLKEAAGEFLRGDYSYCLVSGQINSSRSQIETLHNFGVDSTVVKFIGVVAHRGYSTFNMAVAAQEWLQKNDPKASTLNVFTAGPHGRKSWTIFKRVFGKQYSVGVLSCPVEHCNAGLWWKSKSGPRNLIKYGIGYIYALVWPFEKHL